MSTNQHLDQGRSILNEINAAATPQEKQRTARLFSNFYDTVGRDYLFGTVYNTNSVDTALKRQVILQDRISDFARRLLVASACASVYSDVPLEGTNKVEVPFYPLATEASVAFVSGTGYTTIRDTATETREITIGEGATDGDRLFQALAFSSSEIARQPILKISELAQQKIDKLASDITTDWLSAVTAANYGAAGLVEPLAGFDSDDLSTLKLACKTWPESMRSLVISSEYDAALLKDPSFKSALNAASDLAIKEGRLYPRVFGFNYIECPTLPDNGENLVGFVVHKSALLFATAPVAPAKEVIDAGTRYSVITHAASGISLSYRTFGNPVTDTATHVVECSYGWAKGNANALKRITSA